MRNQLDSILSCTPGSLENDDLENDDLENDDLENDDLENDDKDGVARRIKGLEGYRRREIRGR